MASVICLQTSLGKDRLDAQACQKYKDAEAIIRKKHKLLPAHANLQGNVGLCLAGLVLLIELLSIPAAWNSDLNSALAFIAGIAMLMTAYKKPTLGLGILALEFFIGSKGRLLVFGADIANDGGISLRIIVFAAFMLGWFAARIRKTTFQIPNTILALSALVAYAVWLGFAMRQPFVFADANAWGVLLLIAPIIDLAKHDAQQFWSTLKLVAKIGISWLIVKSIALFYLFSHAFDASFLESIHRWIRRTGVGEITLLGEGGIARVFIQSQIYPLLAAAWLATDAARRRVSRDQWLALALCSLVILISFQEVFGSH